MVNISYLIQVGNRIHLHSMKGTYTVVGFGDQTIIITADTWDGKTKTIPSTDFKCFNNENWIYDRYPLLKIGIKAVVSQNNTGTIQISGPATLIQTLTV